MSFFSINSNTSIKFQTGDHTSKNIHRCNNHIFLCLSGRVLDCPLSQNLYYKGNMISASLRDTQKDYHKGSSFHCHASAYPKPKPTGKSEQ